MATAETEKKQQQQQQQFQVVCRNWNIKKLI